MTRPAGFPAMRPEPRLLAFGLTIALLGIAVAESVIMIRGISAVGELGIDFMAYRHMGERWLATGQFYWPEQLTGALYPNIIGRTVLYPPSTLLFFVPLSILPLPVAAAIWWTGPIAIGATLIRRFQPHYIVWPVLAFVIAWPRTLGAFMFGNTDLWIASAVAAGLLWSWPAVFVTLKPTVLPLALIGIRRRSWWIAAACLSLASLVFLPLWPEYVPVLRNVTAVTPFYSTNLVFILAPLVAWSARWKDVPHQTPQAVPTEVAA